MSSSRWGSFLQQAVAGVESRLDTILGETEEIPPQPQKSGAVTPTVAAPAAKAENGLPRKPAANNPANDRLQERLARAIAAKNLGANSSNVPSRVESPAGLTESPRLSLDAPSISSQDGMKETRSKDAKASEDNKNSESSSGAGRKLEAAPSPSIGDPGSSSPTTILSKTEDTTILIASAPSEFKGAALPRFESNTIIAAVPDATKAPSLNQEATGKNILTGVEVTEKPFVVSDIPATKTIPSDVDIQSTKSVADQELADAHHKEEIHAYIERIDALQAKLKYLSNASAEAAKTVASTAPAGSVEKKLAEKDEQIALLIEEGERMAKNELKHMTVIKKLRAHASEVDQEASETRKKTEKFEKERSGFAERLRRIDAIERESNARQKSLLQTQKTLELVVADRDAKNSMIQELKKQLEEAATKVKAEEIKAIQERLEREQQRVDELQNDLSSVRIEKELEAERAKVKLDELRAKNEREAERARAAEMEMAAEQQSLESRLEVLRTRAEEVTSGATGDAQAKLLRQIETLQSQYSIASENWQRIEASLTSRVTRLEAEKDEALKRETDTRKKAREMNFKSKRTEDEMEALRSKSSTFERELSEQNDILDRLQRRAEEAESALVDAKRVFELEKQSWDSEMNQQLNEERMKWRNDSGGNFSYAHSRAESPVASTHRSLTAEYLGLQNLQARRQSMRSITNEGSGIERLLSRRSSAQPIRPGSGRGTPGTPPVRQDSMQSFTANGEALETPSIHTMDYDNDDFFENIVSPSSPPDKLGDMISMSTVGAGPTVQLVERMSAAVRRLESEKVSTREEISRLASQRDEARAEIVSLMQKVEAQRALGGRVEELEAENEKMNSRYQTTLEMLGEKSELVEELRADVEDVKAMYRELVERTVT